MYAHYLDALAIYRIHGNLSFFITFTCNAKWPEIEEYMEAFPELTTAYRADIVDRVLEEKYGITISLELMMHGPCGLVNKNSTCMKDGNKCNQNFPKTYSNNTYIDKDGFVHYGHRETIIDTISKGTDHVVANITRPVDETVSTTNVPTIQIDEIKDFVEARYIGPHKAYWRMLKFPIHYRDPAVLTLVLHLENMQQI
nr:DNA helicase [Tanacetum cinerariifolium]